MRFTLVHSPLVGPTTWGAVAACLAESGHSVTVPSLLKATRHGRWEPIADAGARVPEGDGPLVLVGHSGAGPLLPQIARRMRPHPDLLLFVDAGVPATSGETDLVPPPFFDHLLGLAEDGVLPRWADWFGDAALDDLIADPAVRAKALAEMPRLRLSYFAERVPVPDGWTATPGAYLLLSEAYGPDLQEAGTRGWPVAVEVGHHLDLLNRPEAITRAILELADAALSAAS